MPKRNIKKSNQVGGWGGRPTTYYSVGGSKNRKNIKRKSRKSKKQTGGWGGRATRYYGIGGSIKSISKKRSQKNKRNQRKTKKQNKNFMFRLLKKYFN